MNSEKRTLQSRLTGSVVFLLIAGAALRIYYVFQIPLYTTDLLRNLGYGYGFYNFGFRIYDLTPFDLSPLHSQFLWPNHHYTYPIFTLLLFASIAGVHASIVFGKLVFFLLDAANAAMIYRMTGDRWCMVLYWLNPIVIWYTACEGQFETWVLFWMILSLWMLQKKKPWAYALLAVAVQTKMFPVFLVFYFAYRMSWNNRKLWLQEAGWGFAGFIPSFVPLLYGSYVIRSFDSSYMSVANPISWILNDPSLYAYYPYWLVLTHFAAGIVFVLACLFAARKQNALIDYSAPIMFTLFAKGNLIGQFWYFVLLPGFCLTVEDKYWRRVLLAMCWLFGFRSLYSIFIGPIGYQNPPDAMVLLSKAFWGI